MTTAMGRQTPRGNLYPNGASAPRGGARAARAGMAEGAPWA